MIPSLLRFSSVTRKLKNVRPKLKSLKKNYPKHFVYKSRHYEIKTSSFTRHQKRFLSVHEYMSQNIMRDFGINVPVGYPARTMEEAIEVAKKIGGDQWIVKAQVLAGGRGLGHFDSGLNGGVHICKSFDEIKTVANKMLGHTLFTKQTGEKGRPCEVIYICEVVKIQRETYLAILMDRQTGGPIIIGSSRGGVNIETIAEEDPSSIIKVPIDIMEGIKKEQAHTVAKKLGFTNNLAQVEDLIMRLYDLFIKKDATMIEINPFAETPNGEGLCLDAKISFDDNALFRQKDIAALRDLKQEDAREVEASKYDLNYIGLDGEIGCLVNGAGLAMATMDIIKSCGGSPANFLDVGGSASEKQVSEAFKILNADENVKSILVNIFGGIMRCDVIAMGILNAVKEIGLKKPIIVRLQGTNVDKAKELISGSEVRIISSDDLDSAAEQSVNIAKMRKMTESTNVEGTFNLPI